MKLQMNLSKQTIRRLGYMSKISIVFVNIGFLKKILEGKKISMEGTPTQLHLSECNFSQIWGLVISLVVHNQGTWWLPIVANWNYFLCGN